MSLYSRKLNWAESKQKIGQDISSGALLALFNRKDIPTFDVSYVYAITVPKDSMKGPYLHSLRTTVLTVILGSLDIVYRDKATSSYQRLRVGSSSPIQVVIPPTTAFCLIGVSDIPAVSINICDFPWSPDSTECSVPEFNCDFISRFL